MGNPSKRYDPLVRAALIVAEHVRQFRIASWLESMCEGNPNKGKGGAGRFDMKNIAVEAALKDEEFTDAVSTLEAERQQKYIGQILNALYQIAPQAKPTYQQ